MYYLQYTFCHRLLIAITCIKHVFDVHIHVPVWSWSIRNETIDEDFPNENFSKVNICLCIRYAMSLYVYHYNTFNE